MLAYGQSTYHKQAYYVLALPAARQVFYSTAIDRVHYGLGESPFDRREPGGSPSDIGYCSDRCMQYLQLILRLEVSLMRVATVAERMVSREAVMPLPHHSKYHPVECCWRILEEHWSGARLTDSQTMLERAKSRSARYEYS